MKKKNKIFNSLKNPVFIGFLLVAFLPAFYFSSPKLFSVNYEDSPETIADSSESVNVQKKEEVPHLKTPSAVRGAYMTSCFAATPSLRDRLVKLIEETELNSVIIDIKDYSGGISIVTEDSRFQDTENRCMVPDMKDFIKSLHEKQIYVIGRVTVFQDPIFAVKNPLLAVQKESDGSVWSDFKGLHFTDPGSKEVWDYHVALSKEAYDMGFDEINFDYIRFPSDGPMKDIYFPVSGNREKASVLESFFSYLHGALSDTGLVMSADLFGMTTTNTDDLNIGQVLERAMPYFDYIAPMVYPSHYPKTWNGFSDPNHYPYEVIHTAMSEAVRRATSPTTPVKTSNGKPIYNEVAKFDEESQTSTTEKVFSGLYEKKVYSPQIFRPWIQDFDYGGDYGPEEVRAQIQAAYDTGLNSWMIWDPSNVYTKEALEPFYNN